MLQRGEYGARVGVPRLLQMLERERLPATFFVPGHTLESFPEPSQQILDAGHEIAHHSYAHVDPSGQTADAERADFDRALAVLDRLGVTPVGYRSPSADLSASHAEDPRGARLPLRLEPDGRRLPAIPAADRRPRVPAGAARPRPRGRPDRDPDVLRARRLAPLPVQLRPIRVGLSAPTQGARDLAGRARLHARARRRRRARRVHAPAGDRARPPRGDARALRRARARARRVSSRSFARSQPRRSEPVHERVHLLLDREHLSTCRRR